MLPTKRYPSDADILAVFTKPGRQMLATYVIANALRMDGFVVKNTAAVRQSLERMVRRGQVVQVENPYGLKDLYWKAAEA